MCATAPSPARRSSPRARRRARAAPSPRARSAPGSAWRRSATRRVSGRPRASSATHTVGVLVLANFGLTEHFVLVRPIRSARARAARRPRAARARASASSPPMRRCSRTSCGGSRGGRSSASRAPAPTARTAPARSPSPGRPPTCCRATARTSSGCACCATIRSACSSPPAPRPPRRPCSNALCAGRELRGYDGKVLPRFPAERFARALTPGAAARRYARAMRIAVIGGAGGMGSVTTADAATSDGVERVLLDRPRRGRARTSSRRRHANVEVRAPGETAPTCAPRWPAPTPSSTPPRTGSTCRSCRPASRSARTTPTSAASTTSRSSSTSSTTTSARPGCPPRSRWARRRASRTCSRPRRVAELETVESIEVLDAGRRRAPVRPGRALCPGLRRRHADRRVHPARADVHRRARAAHAGRRRREDVPPARGRRRVRLHDPFRAGHAAPLLRRPRHPHASSGGSACRPRTRCRCARSSPRGMASTDPVQSSTAARCARATCWSPCSHGRAARPTTRTRSSACAPTSSARAAARASRSTPTSRSRSTPSGAPTRARTRPACRPRSPPSCWRGGQALRTGVGGPEVIIPVARLLRRARDARHARRDQRAPPARLTHPTPRAAGILGAREKWPSG